MIPLLLNGECYILLLLYLLVRIRKLWKLSVYKDKLFKKYNEFFIQVKYWTKKVHQQYQYALCILQLILFYVYFMEIKSVSSGGMLQ